MAERVTPHHDDDHNYDYEQYPIAEYLPDKSRQIYVVQIPKDQVYRVPPPENALYVKQQQDPTMVKKRPLCGKCCLWFFITIIVIFLVFGIIALLITIFLKPKPPKIHIDQLAVTSSSHSMEYDIKLKIKNVNVHTSIEYGQSGVASLSFNSKNVAKGPIPGLDLSNNSNSSIQVALGGSKNNLPKEMAKSMKSKKPKVRVSLLLKLHMPSRTKVWKVKFGSMTFDVSCNFVVDTLTKGNRILSQACVTQFV